MSDQGTGIGVTFASGFFGEITSLALDGISRQAIDITTFATTGGKDYAPSDLYDLGTISIEMLFAPGTAPPIIANTQETVTITWSDSSATTWAATAFMTNFAPNASDAEDRVRASATIQFSGDLTIS